VSYEQFLCGKKAHSANAHLDYKTSNFQAQPLFPERNMRAEFWVNEVSAADAFNDTGIWNYVSTDQVRFVAIDTNEPMELAAIAQRTCYTGKGSHSLWAVVY
jgi:hypothetical protein